METWNEQAREHLERLCRTQADTIATLQDHIRHVTADRDFWRNQAMTPAERLAGNAALERLERAWAPREPLARVTLGRCSVDEARQDAVEREVAYDAEPLPGNDHAPDDYDPA